MHVLRIFLIFVIGVTAAAARSEQLASWNEGSAKTAIVSFVERVTQQGGPDYVAPGERIAVFDNDGTLWAEQPIYFQFAFAIDRVKAMAPDHPEWADMEPVKAILAGDLKALAATGDKGFLQVVAITHTGMTTDEFSRAVKHWVSAARHPKFKKPYPELAYRPMIELLDYLRANGFKTFIVSGGGVEFMRPWVEQTYGIPPEQVVGSSGVVTFEISAGGQPFLKKEAKVEFIDDGPGKPVGINRFIGRRPILAFGNSDGDQQMLEWTAAGEGPRFAGLVHHTDPEREWAYDRHSHIGKLDTALDEALAKQWVVVSMKSDWKRVFVFEP
jgi:phosphoglycolate phosphatase-like HAD superfamily hydrolase